jgi:hypothetical protein
MKVGHVLVMRATQPERFAQLEEGGELTAIQVMSENGRIQAVLATLYGGGCDEQTEAALGSGRTSAFVLAGKTADCRARRTGTLLDGDCGRVIE